MNKYIIFFLIINFSWLNCSFATPLTMAHTQRPPYHYKEGEQSIPKGIMADIVLKVLYDAGIEVEFQVMSANRIMLETKRKSSFCSFTWFKNSERSKFAKFTEALWQDQPFVVVTSREKIELFEQHRTLAEVFMRMNLSFGTRDKMSYGTYIDELLSHPDVKLNIIKVVNTQKNTARMLKSRRVEDSIL